MKKLIAVITLMAVVGMGVSSVVKANDHEAAVTATVTIAAATVTINPTAFDYGTLGTGDTEKYSEVYDSGDNEGDENPALVTATVGDVGTTLNIRGADATGTGDNWTLSGTVGADQYIHKFQEGGEGSFVALTTEAQTLDENVPAEVTATFDLEISTPSSVSKAEGMSVPVTVIAVAGE